MALFKMLNGPQRSSGRVGLVSVSDALDMGIDNARLSDVGLKAGPALAQVVPESSKPNHGFDGVGGEARSQIAHGPKMFVQQMGGLPAALWGGVGPVQPGCIRDHSHVPVFVGF
jgi:hypothetical protein